MLLAEGAWLEPKDFPVLAAKVQAAHGIALPAEGVDLEELERSLVVQALERSGYNQTRSAALLGLNRDQIRYRIEKFGLVRTCSRLSAARVSRGAGALVLPLLARDDRLEGGVVFVDVRDVVDRLAPDVPRGDQLHVVEPHVGREPEGPCLGAQALHPFRAGLGGEGEQRLVHAVHRLVGVVAVDDEPEYFTPACTLSSTVVMSGSPLGAVAGVICMTPIAPARLRRVWSMRDS